jgi:glycosyltransferase involved in cell wall biosynthesis
VLSSAGVGGTEARFTEIWVRLREEGHDVHLVIDRQTFHGLQRRDKIFGHLTVRDNLHIAELMENGYRSYVKNMHQFFAKQPKGVVCHFPLAYPIAVKDRFRHRLLVSWVDARFPKLVGDSWRNSTIAWLSFLVADGVDVLNPLNYSRFQQIPWMRTKITLTQGGSFSDPDVYMPLKKTLSFVFLARFDVEKQGLRLVQMLPDVYKKLTDLGLRDFKFCIHGDGLEYGSIERLIRGNSFRNVEGLKIDFGHVSKPSEVLNSASIFFSLQKSSNYPSKSLIEALYSGAFPILTDVGETRDMVDGLRHKFFVNRDFTADEIVEGIMCCMSTQPHNRLLMSQEISCFAKSRFSFAVQLEYFRNLYTRLASSEASPARVRQRAGGD